MTSKSSSTIAAHSNRGFTLLELLIVITILAVLSSVVLIILQPATLLQRARDSRRMSDLQAMQKVIERIILDTGTAPPPGPPGWCTQIWNPCYPEVKNLLGQYMAPVPQDPSFQFEKGYFYRKDSDTGYTLAAIVERPENANGSYNEGACGDSPTTTSCIVNPRNWTSTTYNYIIQVVRP